MPKEKEKDEVKTTDEKQDLKDEKKNLKKVEIDTSKQEVVDKSKLDAVVKLIHNQNEEIAILKDAVSQGRLGLARDKRLKKGGRRVFLKVFTDKKGEEHLITGWKSSPENKIIYSETTGMPVGEIIMAKYYFHDGSDSGDIDQIRVTRIEKLAYADVEKEDNETGDFYLRMDDTDKWGRDLIKVNKTFVNP